MPTNCRVSDRWDVELVDVVVVVGVVVSVRRTRFPARPTNSRASNRQDVELVGVVVVVRLLVL